ncbi:MAG: DNA primase [Candidatus Magasanikbacteria bacterium]|nr:DNA primase [Candidatus Magasanikbacteria bacterium]
MSDVDLIKERLDLVQFIGEYVSLKKSGVNWKGLCPFHQEKTPSFMVQPERQFWHCFGCSKGGDIFTFAQEVEGLQFIEALKFLADRAGVTLTASHSELQQSERNRLLSVTEEAARFWHRFLLELPAARLARDYLKERGVRPESQARWQLGYAPAQWDLLTRYLLKKGFSIDDLIAAGISIARAASGRGAYDRFRDRIMFPLFDAHGTVVGFTGRQLRERPEAGGKYVNTPETPIYHKSSLLYGLHLAKTAIKQKDNAVIVEGQLDVISSHQAGQENVVAASGTALTSEQVKLLKRYTSNLSIAFDADTAGAAADERGVGVALREGCSVRVITVPADIGKDADEVLRKNPAAWLAAVAAAAPILEWLFSSAQSRFSLSDPRQRQQAADWLLPYVMDLAYPLERDFWLKRLALLLQCEVATLREAAERLRQQKRPRLSAAEPDKESLPRPALLPAAPAAVSLLQDWFGLLAKFPAGYRVVRQQIPLSAVNDRQLAELYAAAEQVYNNKGSLTLADWREALTAAGIAVLDLLLLKPYASRPELTEAEAMAELKQLAVRYLAEWRRAEGRRLQQEIAAAEKSGDPAHLDALLSELQLLGQL